MALPWRLTTGHKTRHWPRRIPSRWFAVPLAAAAATQVSAQTQTGPALHFQESAGNLRLSWPVEATGFRLESADSLPPFGQWQVVPEVVSVVDGEFVVSTGLGEVARFYRLAPLGVAPVLLGLEPAFASVRLPVLPNRVNRVFTLAWSDADADVGWVRVQLVRPDGESVQYDRAVAGHGFFGTTGTNSLPLLRLTPDDPPGEYRMQAALVDSSGQVGEARTAIVIASPDSGEVDLAVEDASVVLPGDLFERRIHVTGRGFDAADPQRNRVQIGARELVVLSATGTELEAQLPPDVLPGRVRVANLNGSAWSPEPLAGLPLELSLDPESVAVVAGGTQPFAAKLNSHATDRVVWFVDGIAGGNAAVGLISEAGIFTAPKAIPDGGTVMVSAALASDASLLAEARVAVVAPAAAEDSGIVVAAVGGEVATGRGRARVVIPPGSLSSDAVVSLRLLDGPDLPAAPAGRRILAAFNFDATPVQAARSSGRNAALPAAPSVTLLGPVEVTVPLATGQAPGNNPVPGLEVRAAGQVLDLPPPVASGDGSSMSLLLPQTGEFVVYIPVVQLVGPDPEITELVACNSGAPGLEEGRSVPLKIVGRNLTSDLQVEVYREELNQSGEAFWAGTRDVIPGTLQILNPPSTIAGVTLHIGTIRDLGDGETRRYHLVLRRPDNHFASYPFRVAGLNELFLAPGEVRSWNSDGTVRFSEIEIPSSSSIRIAGPRLSQAGQGSPVLRGGVLRLESTGPMRIFGRIDGSGGRGQPGFRAQGGGPGGGAATLAGQGGQGRRGSDCDGLFLYSLDPKGYIIAGEFDPRCRSDLEAAIGDTARDRTAAGSSGIVNYLRAYGIGGIPGENGSLLEDVIAVASLVINAFSSVVDAIGCVTTGTTCVAFIADAAGAAGSIENLIEHFSSEEGRGHPGNPGEGAALSGDFRGHSGGGGGGGGRYNYVFGSDPGGGGGGGGEGGRGVVLASSANISLGGFLVTAGGAGGQASEDSDFIPGRNGAPSPSRFSGGGGGGGSGGDVAIASLGRAFIPLALVDSSGGLPGVSGISLQRSGGLPPVVIADPRSRPAEDGRRQVRSSPQPESPELVLSRRLLVFRGTALSEPATLIIRSEGNAVRRVTVAPGQRVRAVLFDGFNRIYDARDEGGSDILQRCVLVLPDGVAAGPDPDGDGLGTNDELELGTNPNSPDTDGDGLPDLVELNYCRNPRVAEPPGLESDRDCDGWPDAFETAAGTLPDDPASAPSATFAVAPGRIEVSRSEMTVPQGIFSRGPTFLSRPQRLEVSRPAFDEPGIAVPNTAVSRPAELNVIVGGK